MPGGRTAGRCAASPVSVCPNISAAQIVVAGLQAREVSVGGPSRENSFVGGNIGSRRLVKGEGRKRRHRPPQFLFFFVACANFV